MKRASHGILTPYSARLTEGLLAYYSFNDSLVKDDSGNEHNLTNINSVTARAGKIDDAADFDRASNQSFLTNGIITTDISALSISLWLKLDSINSDYLGILSCGENAFVGPPPYDYFSFYLRVSGAKTPRILNLWWIDSTNVPHVTLTAQPDLEINDTNWNHIAFVLGNGSLVWWINGQKFIDSTSLSITESTVLATNGVLYLGSQFNEAGFHFDGGLDEVGLYNRGLSDSEIAYLYNGGNGRTYVNGAIL